MKYYSTRTSGPFGPLVLVSYAFNWVQGFTDSQTGVLIWISNGQTWYWEKVSPNILICLKNSSFESVAMFTHGWLFYYWTFYRTLENTEMKFDTVEKVMNSRMYWNHKRTPLLIISWCYGISVDNKDSSESTQGRIESYEAWCLYDVETLRIITYDSQTVNGHIP